MLSPRQRQILGLIAQGCSNQAVAKMLGVSLKSVENQINLLYQTIGVDGVGPEYNPRVQAVRIFLRESRNV
jgi:DNA-binding NarL/FixJ family response regulator